MSELLSDLDLDDPNDSGKVKPSKSQRIEHALLLMADAVWAVVGLVLWIPQIVRVVITSAIRLVHAALTRQPIDSIRGPIRRVSRFYVDGFLSPDREKTNTRYGSRQLQLGRFLTEALWVVMVWLAVLRLVNKEAFSVVFQQLSRFGSWLWAWAVELTRTVATHLPESVRAFGDLGTGTSLGLAIALIVFLAAGYILGRRRR